VLARQDKFADDYEQTVAAIAAQIDKVRQLAVLPELPNPPGAAELRDTFATEVAAAAAAPLAGPAKGPNGVRFAYVAAARPEVGAKGNQTPYGSRSEEWQPSPIDDRVIGVLAPMVATASRFIPYQLTLDGTFQEQVRQAQKDNALVVLLVDVWTACFVQKYRERMQEYDGHGSIHCAALVVWNEQDGDLAAQRDDLETALQHVVFPVNHSRAQPYYHRSILSVSELETALRATLERLRTDVATQAQVFRKLEAMARPAISNVAPSPPTAAVPAVPSPPQSKEP
jgi:FxsC-like protein